MGNGREPIQNSSQQNQPDSEKFEWADHESIRISVLQAVSSASSVDVFELPPLYDEIDPEALETALTHDPNSARGGEIRIAFTYADYRVMVSSTGDGVVLPA